LLIRDHFKLSVDFKTSYDNYENDLSDGVAGLVIGDRAFPLHSRYKYVYDLGEEWKKHTGLPFVFAAWVSKRPLNHAFIEQLNAALGEGIQDFNQHIGKYERQYPEADVKTYFERYIQLNLDEDKHKTIELFLSRTRDL
jgi:chorismate dehydratase